RAALSASLSRGISVNDDADVQVTTTGTLGLTYDVTDLSLLSFDLGYTDITDAGSGGVTDRARGNVRIAYSHELAQDWRLTAGYERRYLTEAGSGDAWDNAVFLTLNRTFTILP
ncbi:MAG: hypothetical protein AAF727_11340, partial [Pseudomonadota bacterium]